MTTESCELFLGDYANALYDRTWDALIVDAPYGARTHDASSSISIAALRERRSPSSISYSCWSSVHVAAAVRFLAPRTAGWFCSITSHDLIGAWSECLAAEGRYVFAPVPLVIPGMSVRLVGDGPSSEAVYMVVARPKTKAFARWGTLPGYYFVAPGDPQRRSKRIGGKPLGLMERIVGDYSRVGDLVCDPCAGAGTTLLAALRTGRRAVGSEIDPEAHAIASAALEAPRPLSLFY